MSSAMRRLQPGRRVLYQAAVHPSHAHEALLNDIALLLATPCHTAKRAAQRYFQPPSLPVARNIPIFDTLPPARLLPPRAVRCCAAAYARCFCHECAYARLPDAESKEGKRARCRHARCRPTLLTRHPARQRDACCLRFCHLPLIPPIDMRLQP